MTREEAKTSSQLSRKDYRSEGSIEVWKALLEEEKGLFRWNPTKTERIYPGTNPLVSVEVLRVLQISSLGTRTRNMSAMANTTSIVTTVTKTATKEKTLKEMDATPRVNILDFCEEHYKEILLVIMDKVRRDKRKEVHIRLDFRENSKKSRRMREGSQNSSVGTLPARYRNPSERPKERARLRSNDENVFGRLGHRRQSVFERLSGTYSQSTTLGIIPTAEVVPIDETLLLAWVILEIKTAPTIAKRGRRNESPLSHVSESDTSKGGHWKYKSKRRKPTDEEDLVVPWTCEETIEDFIKRFKVETGRMRGAPECMRISGFMHRVNNLELTKRLNEQVPKTMEEMMTATTTFIRGETVAASKKKGLPLTRTPKKILAAEEGKFEPPPPMVTPIKKRSSNKFCDFHNDKGHSMDECMQPKKEIEELVRADKLSHLIKEIKQSKEQSKAGKKDVPTKDKSMAIYMVQLWHRITRQKVTQSFTRNNKIRFPPLTSSGGIEGPLVIYAEIGGHMIHRVYVDGGSSTEVLYEHCFNRLRQNIKRQMVPATTSLTSFSGETIWPLGQLRLLVIIGDADHSTKAWMNFMIISSLSPNNGIIGRPGIQEIQAVPSTAHGMLKFLVDGGIVTIRSTILILAECATMTTSSKETPKEDEVHYENFKVDLHPNFLDQEVTIGGMLSAKERTKLCSLLKKNLDVFAWQPSDMTGVPISIAEHRLNIREGYSPVRQKKRGQAPERAKSIQAEVHKLVEAGIMREVYYHDWLSNPVMVKKHDGSWRMCVDFTDLNKAYPQDCYHLSEIDWKVESLCGYPFKCFLDAYKGYHQIQMAESDEEKMAFHTSQGVYCYTKMHFGLKNAGATYQQLVDKAFDNQVGRNTEVYVDDLVIKSHTEAELLRDIDETFRTLRKINMKLNPKKCTFEAVEGMFLGFLSKSAEKSLPLFKTLKKCIKKSDFHWTPEAEQAFKQLKQKLSELPLLVAPKPKEELIVYLSASHEAISAVLMTERGIVQTPVYFISRALQGPELNYTPMEKLVLSLVFAAKRLRRTVTKMERHAGRTQYQIPAKDVCERTDPSGFPRIEARRTSTRHISGSNPIRTMDVVHGRIVMCRWIRRWLNTDKPRGNEEKVKSLVSGFATFSISQVTRSKNKKADALSKIASTSFAQLSKLVLVEIIKEKSIKEKEVTTVVKEDGPTWMTPIIEYLKDGTLPDDKKEASKLHIKARHMHARPRSVVDNAMRLGYYWPTMHRDARDMIHTCNDCQIHHPVPRNTPTTANPYHDPVAVLQVGIDIDGPFPEGPGKVKFLIVAMDYFTKWIEAKAVATITRNQDWCEKLNITQRFTLVKHPQTNRLVERANQSLGEGIKARLGEGNKNWIEELSHVLWAHHTMIKSSHGDTYFSLTYGTEAVIPTKIGMRTYRTTVVDTIHNNKELRLNLDLLDERRKCAAIREAKAILKMTKYYNARVRGVTFMPGDFVYRSNEASHAADGGKLGQKWEGPYEVTKALRDGAYKLKFADGTVLPRTWNIANLKSATSEPRLIHG
ncbi:reverse transcriptase domain-containing protein [Tanacetum coccineum]